MLVGINGYAQTCNKDEVIKKYHFTVAKDTFLLRFNLTAWEKISPDAIAAFYRKTYPEKDYNCLVDGWKQKEYKDIVLSVLVKETNEKKEQRFSVDTWRALIYQK